MRVGVRAGTGLVVAAAAALFAAQAAEAATTTISFNEGQITFGGPASSIVNPAQPVRMQADIDDAGDVNVEPDGFDFPPAAAQVGPGQVATIDLIPEGTISGRYNRTTGELNLGALFTIQADYAGATCEIPNIILNFSSSATPEPFVGDPFDVASVPPVNGAIAARLEDLPGPQGGIQCTALGEFTEGDGAIRVANTSTGPEGGELAARVNKKQLVYGQEATIKGELSGVPSGSGGHQVELIERPFPYDTPSTRVRREITKEDGTYAFKVKPGFNTRYVVRDASGSGAQSESIQIWVYEDFKLEVRVFHRTEVRAQVGLTLGRGLETDFTKRQMLWYFQKKGERTATLKKKTRIRQQPGKYSSKATFDIPNSRQGYRFYVFTCFDEPRGDDGTGKPGRYKCPRKNRVRAGDFRNS